MVVFVVAALSEVVPLARGFPLSPAEEENHGELCALSAKPDTTSCTSTHCRNHNRPNNRLLFLPMRALRPTAAAGASSLDILPVSRH